MNEHQLYIKIIAFLGNKAEGIIAAAQSAMKTTYGIVDGETKAQIRWQQRIAQSAFFQTLFAGLIACIFISAWRIVSMIVHGESFYFLALAFATVIAETINEAMMVFMSAYNHLPAEKKEDKAGLSWSNFFHYFSLMGVFRLISRLLFGRELPILQYLLVYLILVGVAFNLDYELGLTGFAAKGFHILYAMLPIVGIGILSHYLGVNLREAKHEASKSNLDFEKLWQAEKLQWILNVLEVKVQSTSGAGYAAKTLEYYYSLVSSSSDNAVSSEYDNSGNMAHSAGFAMLAMRNNVATTAQTGYSENYGKTESFRSSDLELARKVLEAYPNLPMDERGWNGRINQVTGLSVGRPTSRIWDAMKHIKSGKDVL